VLVVIGLASIWAFVGGKYPNVPEDVTPAVSVLICPQTAVNYAGVMPA